MKVSMLGESLSAYSYIFNFQIYIAFISKYIKQSSTSENFSSDNYSILLDIVILWYINIVSINLLLKS